MGKLTVKKCESIILTDKILDLSDGDGLYLRVKPSGARTWILRVVIDGKVHVRGLGVYAGFGTGGEGALTLAQARLAAVKRRGQLLAGELADVSVPTPPVGLFSAVAEDYIQQHLKRWKHPDKMSAAWRYTLSRFASPVIGGKTVEEISVQDIKAILDPIWHTKNETAHRVRNRIETILDYAYLLKGIDKSNPARWKGCMELIYHTRRPVDHFPSLPYTSLPPVVHKLIASRFVTSKCLLWIILSACRTSEGRGATWGEIDMDRLVWTIPAVRTKTGKEHVVPLSEGMISILQMAKGWSNGTSDSFIFDNGRGAALADTSVSKPLKRLSCVREATVHGLRSSFRDWAAERTNYPREVVEQALAHSLGAVEAAYRRSDLLNKRRTLMAEWWQYLSQNKSY